MIGFKQFLKESQDQNEVRAAAAKNGYIVPAVHGTAFDFDEFVRGKYIGGIHPTRELGFFFAPDTDEGRSSATFYAGNAARKNDVEITAPSVKVLRVYLSLNNPIEFEAEEFYSIRGQGKIDRLKRELPEQYDGIIVHGDGDYKDEYVVFNANQIKSAAIETEFPLDERFDSSSNKFTK